jgi:beta-galactosidase
MTLSCVATMMSATAAKTIEARPESSLNQGWRFHFGDANGVIPTMAGAKSWPAVDIPHTWNASDGADGGADYARGAGWYVTTFSLPTSWAHRRVFIEFAGASRVATVYLNGQPLGEHVGGFARFRFDLTDGLAATGENTLAVRVSNAEDGTPPISADFTFFGGLYREVRLFATDAVHIDPLDCASDGVYISQDDLSAERANISVATLLKNDSAQDAQLSVRTVFFDTAGTIVAEREDTATLPAGGSMRFSRPLEISHPHLWAGRDDPYLYTVETSLVRDGVILDAVTQRTGLRFFRVDPEHGFFLNGRAYDLHGMSRHQDRAGTGWAISEGDERQDFAMIEEIGATAIRVAHYPQSKRWFDFADERGMIVWAEIPVVNEVPATGRYTENAKLQLRELIRQNFNRPGIVFWGVGNETREMGETASNHQANGPAANRLIEELAALAKAEDPTRMSVYASYHKPDDVKNFHTDALGYNKYIGWYGGDAREFGAWMDGVHKRFPELRLAVSEYGAGGNVRQHDDPQHKPAPGGDWHPEEYQAWFHEVHWQAMSTREYLWGKFVWNMFDFAADNRSEGSAPGINDKGLVSYDRTIRKDAFYWYKANWSREPVLYITSRRDDERLERQAEVKVYSNASDVELFVNEISQGTLSATDRIFRWKIALAPGPNRIRVRASREGRALTDECLWTFKPPLP